MRFFLFFATFFAVYGLVHFYAYRKVRKALAMGRGVASSLAAFMALMVCLPFAVRISERMGIEVLGLACAFVGYTWMGFIFFFLCASLLVDAFRLLAASVDRVLLKGPNRMTLSHRSGLVLSLAMSVAVTAYGYYEALDIHNDSFTIMTDKLPKDRSRLRIAQISDVHLGVMVREERLRRILDAVKRANPDILVATGDLVDGQMDNLHSLAEMLRNVQVPYGKYAVTGNHEFYAGLEEALEFIRDSGFTILRGEAVSPKGLIYLVGVDDPGVHGYGPRPEMPSERHLLSKIGRDKFVILLKHRPDVDEKSLGLFDLQLSGHTHKGQIFPWTLLVKGLFVVDAGFLSLPGGSAIYVNRGAGTWGPPIRFLAPPEVTIIDIVRKD